MTQIVTKNGGSIDSSEIEQAAIRGANASLSTATWTRTLGVPNTLSPTNAADLVSVAGGLRTTGALAYGSVPAAPFGANVNDLPNPLTPFFRVDSAAGTFWSGMVPLPNGDGQLMRIRNISGAFNVTITNQDLSSAAANRFSCTGGVDAVLTPGTMTSFIYDATEQRWVQASGISGA